MSSFQESENMILVKANCFKHLYTKIRDQSTSDVEWRIAAQRIMTILCEEGLSYANPTVGSITTPTGCTIAGTTVDVSNIVAVSIIRAGDSMLDTFMKVAPEASVGKILIQRNEETKEPVLFYSKLPDLTNKYIILLDPMLATGGSARCAVDVLLKAGAVESNMMFLNVLGCPEGFAALSKAYPAMKIVSGACDEGLNEKAYIVPGLGDFGDRFFGTR